MSWLQFLESGNAHEGHIHDAHAPALEVQGVSAGYDTRMALENIDFTLSAGSRLAIVGPNGAGKSTLFKVICGALEPQSGVVKVAGHGSARHICIAYLPQRSDVDWDFPVTVRDVVSMGRVRRIGYFRHAGRNDHAIVERSLERVGMTDLADRQIADLSGGQQQRMFIARALAQEAELILMDEPLTGLDAPSADQIFRIIDDLHESAVTVIVATHNLEMASERFEQVMLLNHRMIAFGKPDVVFAPENLKDAYHGHLQLLKTDEGIMVVNDTCCDGGHAH